MRRKAGVLMRRVVLHLLFPVVAIGCGQSIATAQCEMGPVNAADAAAGDQFGFSVAMSGNLCVVGARLDDSQVVNCGAAYIFRYDALDQAWLQEKKLTAFDKAAGDEFGYSVAIFDGDESAGQSDLVVVGARHDDDKGTDSGSAYIYKYNGARWSLAAKVTASDGAATDRFGSAVAVASNYALIGARDDNAPGTNTGSAYVFHFNGATWLQQAKLTASDAAANDQFGHSVALTLGDDGSSAIALIGAWHDDYPISDSGSAYVFRSAGTASPWVQEAKLAALDAGAFDEFGCSVSIRATSDGEVALIGARNNDDAGPDSGSAYIFAHNEGTWLQQAKLTAADAAAGDQFGCSVSLPALGEAAVVGAWRNDQAGPDAGAAYVFQHQTSANPWPQIAKLVSSNAAPDDVFGVAVAASDDRAIVSAHQSDYFGNDSGQAFLFAGVSGIDYNLNGVADGCDVPGDVNGDSAVNFSDLMSLMAVWGACASGAASCQGDMNADGVVNVLDLLLVISQWS